MEVSPTGGKWWRLKYRFDRRHDNVVYNKLTIGAAKRTFAAIAVIAIRKIMTIAETDLPAE